jgi:hypothetical protein
LPLPDALAKAFADAGFVAAIVTVIEPGKAPQTLIAPDKANIVDERFEIPADQVRIGNEDLRGSRFLSYIFEGTTTQTNCVEWREEGGRWVCVKVQAP